MRNLRGSRTPGWSTWARLPVVVIAGFLAHGCAAPPAAGPTAGASTASAKHPAPRPPAAAPGKALKSPEARQALTEAFAAFDRKQYDTAMAGAQRVLAGNATGPGAAEAHYLRGRIFEEQSIHEGETGNVASAKASLQSAREAYNAAMAAKPAPATEGNIRAGSANVAYFQDDYAVAIAEGMAAFEKLTDPATKAWVLYRVGLSQQRFGNFAEADRTFQTVQAQFPSSEPAKRAVAHQGARGFHVQIGAYATPANADAALSALRADGVIGMRLTDPAGRDVVRVGPARTYDEAKALRTRLAAKYPGAIIIP